VHGRPLLVDPAWFQRLNFKYDELLSASACIFNSHVKRLEARWR
jgi:hypothetical protein